MIRFCNQPRYLLRLLLAVALVLPMTVTGEEQAREAPALEKKPAAGEEPAPAPKPASELEAALERLKLPGVKINMKERCVDVESHICLEAGMLELIACTVDSKEHESIIAIDALPKHVHTALLLLGARPGNPAMRKAIDDEGMRWIDIPPQGDPVDVFLVVNDEEGKPVERPISDFLVPSEEFEGGPADGEDAKFPTHTFLFAGSVLHGDGEGPRKYLSDLSGNVISISTFGDEVLCLPGIHSHANGRLAWQVDGTHLPGVGGKVTLRLRPQIAGRAPGQSKPRPATPSPDPNKTEGPAAPHSNDEHK